MLRFEQIISRLERDRASWQLLYDALLKVKQQLATELADAQRILGMLVSENRYERATFRASSGPGVKMGVISLVRRASYMITDTNGFQHELPDLVAHRLLSTGLWVAVDEEPRDASLDTPVNGALVLSEFAK